MIPNPYVIIGAIGIWLASILGGYFYGTHHEALAWKAATAELKIEAAAKLNEANEATAKKNDDNAILARNLEESHAKRIQDIDDTRADFERKLALSVRDAERRAGRRCQLPSPSGDSGHTEDAAAGSDPGRGCVNPDAVRRVRDTMKKLQADVKTAVEWANGVGR